MAPSTFDQRLLETLLADEAAVVRTERVAAATRLVVDGDLPDADSLAAAVLDEFLDSNQRHDLQPVRT